MNYILPSDSLVHELPTEREGPTSGYRRRALPSKPTPPTVTSSRQRVETLPSALCRGNWRAAQLSCGQTEGLSREGKREDISRELRGSACHWCLSTGKQILDYGFIKGLVTSFLTYFYFVTNQYYSKNEIQRYQNHSVKILGSDFTR